MDRALLIFAIIAQIGLSACAAEQHYIGLIVDCDDRPTQDVEVQAWRNQWIPFRLPEQLGTVYSGADGSFELITEKSASFFTFSGKRLVMQSHPKKSESKCKGDAA